MDKTIEIPFKDISGIVRLAFPGATSRRTVKIRKQKSYHVHDYWDGGSREYAVFLNLRTKQVIPAPAVSALREGHVYNLAYGEVELSGECCVVVNTIFCGKDLGYFIYVPEEVQVEGSALLLPPKSNVPLLPEKKEESL